MKQVLKSSLPLVLLVANTALGLGVWLGAGDGQPEQHNNGNVADEIDISEFLTQTYPDPIGEDIVVKEVMGELNLINFWATWCGPCLQEMPILDRMHEKYESAGFTLFGVNVDTDPLKAERFIQQLGVSFPILYDDESIAGDLYDVDSMPFSVFIDRAGYLRYVRKEFKPGDEKGYEPIIQALVLN